MSNLYKQLSVYFLLLCIIASLIPFNLFHDHTELKHCDKSDLAIEVNLCHVTVHHDQTENASCQHETHINEAANDCGFCQFFISQRDQFHLNQSYDCYDIIVGQDQIKIENTYLLSDAKNSILGRAPPRC